MAGLRGINHQTGLFLSNQIHACPGGEIVRRLSATVQHDDQWKRLALITARDVELISASSRRVGISRFNELSALWHDVRRGYPHGLVHPPP